MDIGAFWYISHSSPSDAHVVARNVFQFFPVMKIYYRIQSWLLGVSDVGQLARWQGGGALYHITLQARCGSALIQKKTPPHTRRPGRKYPLMRITRCHHQKGEECLIMTSPRSGPLAKISHQFQHRDMTSYIYPIPSPKRTLRQSIHLDLTYIHIPPLHIDGSRKNLSPATGYIYIYLYIYIYSEFTSIDIYIAEINHHAFKTGVTECIRCSCVHVWMFGLGWMAPKKTRFQISGLGGKGTQVYSLAFIYLLDIIPLATYLAYRNESHAHVPPSLVCIAGVLIYIVISGSYRRRSTLALWTGLVGTVYMLIQVMKSSTHICSVIITQEGSVGTWRKPISTFCRNQPRIFFSQKWA